MNRSGIRADMLELEEHLQLVTPVGMRGRVSRLIGLTAVVSGFPAPVGALCRIERENGQSVPAEVVGFRQDETLAMPYGQLEGIRPGNYVSLVRSAQAVRVGERLLGRVLDGRGRFIDGRPAPVLPHCARQGTTATSPVNRPRIDQPLGTGIRSIDGLLTCGKGQRLGIFSGSGVGKSVLLGQIAQYSSADVNVVALIGERSREVREFLERDLGQQCLQRSVVVVATSDQPALLRVQAAQRAAAIAEYFRDTGRDVVLMMDSVTRVALAQREIGLAAGEPPATRGYPPSVFALLPRLLERSGRTEQGSITGFYTVLVEADDPNEPISDTVRGILDGHLMLSRKLANKAHWPAIDVLASVSRSMNDIVDAGHRKSADTVKRLLAAYQQAEDLISVGAYQSGSSSLVDTAIRFKGKIDDFLRQELGERVTVQDAVTRLREIAQQAKNV